MRNVRRNTYRLLLLSLTREKKNQEHDYEERTKKREVKFVKIIIKKNINITDYHNVAVVFTMVNE
jgi:hypothetical protein